MREQSKQWQSKTRITKRWMMGAIATPVMLGMVGWLWLVPEPRLQANSTRLSSNDTAPLAHSHREPLINRIRMITAVSGGIFLLLKFRFSRSNLETADLSGANLNEVDFSNADLSGADLNGADLNGANLRGADLSGADLNGANLIRANLCGANLNRAEFRYANLNGADLRYTNLSGADLRHANLSGANLNCVLLTDTNLSDANLSNALLFFTNLRDALNLEPLQLEAKPSPFLCNVALPAYAQQPDVNPNRACSRMPQLLSARYDISLEEAQAIVEEARQHHWG